MGITALSHVEIKAWADLTGAGPTGVEVGLMRRISRIYVSQHSVSKDPKAPPPVHVQMSREEVAKGFKKWFGKLGNRGN